MRRALWVLTVFISFALVFTVPSYAKEKSHEGYLESFHELVGESGELSEKIGIEELFSEILSAISSHGGKIVEFSAFVLGGVMLIALASLLSQHRGVQSAVTALIIAGMYGFVYELVSTTQKALEGMSGMFFSLIPIMSGVTLAGGGVSSAGAEATAMGAVFGAVGGIFTPLLLPLVSLMFALSVSASLGGAELRSLFSKARSVFMWLLGIVTAVLLGAIALQSVICSAKDSAAMRVAKYSASGLLPVIGGTVSASLSSLASGLSYAKSIIGAEAIYVLLTLALSPLVLILAYRLVISIASGLLSLVGTDSSSGALFQLTFSFDALLSVYSVSLVLYIFEIVMFMKSGVALL